jgi:hypothetical protein
VKIFVKSRFTVFLSLSSEKSLAGGLDNGEKKYYIYQLPLKIGGGSSLKTG